MTHRPDWPRGFLERRRTWGDTRGDIEHAWSKDELLPAVMLYWVTESAATSMRYYREAWKHRWEPSHMRIPALTAPVGVSVHLPDRPPVPMTSSARALLDGMDIVSHNEHDVGGHFPPCEVPDLVVHDLRDTFATVRSRSATP